MMILFLPLVSSQGDITFIRTLFSCCHNAVCRVLIDFGNLNGSCRLGG